MPVFKPLAPLGSSTFIEEAVARFRKAGVSDVRVVIGHGAHELMPVLDRLGVRHVLNSDHERGMYSSILAGIQSLEPGVDAFFLLPVDIPLVAPRSIRLLLDAHDFRKPRILYPRFDRKRGHPPLIPTALVRRGLPPEAPGGFRSILQNHDSDAMDVDVADEAILLDCNTPGDYRLLVRRWSMGEIPTERECEAIWGKLQVPPAVKAHCAMVAGVAGALGARLIQSGLRLDLPLVVAAGRLHDIARAERDHARAGAGLIEQMGYPRVAAVVARHTDISPVSDTVGEAELLYLADKCVEEDRLVSLEERFRKSMARHADRPDVLRGIRKRLEDARTIARRVETLLGHPLEEVIHRLERSIRAASSFARRRIHLVRHGAVQYPGEPRRFIGQMDLPLNELGRLQAERLRDALREAPISAVHCSDLRRSRDTAEIIAAPHGLACMPGPELREISLGAWEGLAFDEVRRSLPREFMERGLDMVHYRPPRGESFLDCTCRVMAALHGMLQTSRGDILIVGHGGVNRIILCQARGWPLDRLFEIPQDHGCLNLIQCRGHALEIEVLNTRPFADFSGQNSPISPPVLEES